MADETTGNQDFSTLSSGDTQVLIRATNSSFHIITSLSAARADNSGIQTMIRRIRDEGTKYMVSVSESVKTAELGYQFANRAQFLCDTLAERNMPKEGIQKSIAEMRKIAQDAHATAKATADRFRTNRQEFTKIRTSASDILSNIEAKREQLKESRDKANLKASSWKQRVNSMMGRGENGSSALQIVKTTLYLPAIAITASGARVYKGHAKGREKKLSSYDQELERLGPVSTSLDELMVEMNVLARYWLEVDIVLADIESRITEIDDDSMLDIMIRGLQREWKEVAEDYKAYRTALMELLDNNPQYANFVTSNSAITV